MANRSHHQAFVFITQIFLVLFSITSSLFIFYELAHHLFSLPVLFLDKSMLQLISQLRTPHLTALMLVATHLGDVYILGFIALLTWFFLYQKGRKKDAVVFIFILVSGCTLNILLKNVFDRPRPNINPLQQLGSYSFPSSHALNSFILYTSLSYFVFRKMKNRTKAFFLMSVCTFIILVVGFSRVYLGVHYPTDVLAGYMAGLFWFTLVILFQRAISSLLAKH